MNTAGATTLAGPIGGGTPLTSVTTDQPGTVTVGSVTTTGAQSYQENTVSLTGTYTTTNSAWTAGTAAAAVTLGGNTTITTGTGPIAFNGTINGAQSLTLNSTGTTTLAGAVGGSTPLSSLTTNAGGTTAVNGGSVTTTGNQVYGDAVTLTQATTFTSPAGTVQFDNTVTNSAGGASITVDAPTITLNAATTVATTNGNLSFFTDTLNTNGASINAGTGSFAIAPNTMTKTIEFGDVDTARTTDVYYSSNFGSIVAGSFTVGRPAQTGNIFVTGVANLTTPLTVINGGTGALTVENAPLTSPNNSSIGLVSGSGGTTLAADVNVGTGTLRITSTGVITQSGGAITADTLALAAGTGINVAQAGNDVTTLAAQTIVGGLAFRDSDGFIIGSIAASGDGFHPAITGINAGVANVALSAGGPVTQTAPIIAGGLSLQGTGPYTLPHGANDVDTIAANTTGTIEFTDVDSLTVGTVPAVGSLGAISGLSSGNNDIALITGGALTLNQAVNAGTADVGLQANGPVTQGAAGTITANELNLRGNGPFTLTNNANDVNTVGATVTGALQLNDVDDLTVGAVAAVGTIPASGGLTSGNNDIALITGGALTLNQAVNAGTADVGLQANGPVTQGAAGTITANELNLRGSGPFTLTNNANDVNTVGATVTGALQLNDVDDLTVGAVAAVGTIPASGGLTSGNNDIALITGGALTLNQAVNAGTADVGLQANGPVTQGAAGTITANELNLRGSGPFTLTNNANDVNTVGATVTGALQLNDVDDLTVGAVAAVGTIPASGGLTSGNNDIALITGGALTLNQAVNAGTGNIGIASGGSTTQGGAGQLTGDNLNLQGNGPYVLTNPNNDINTAGGTVLASVVSIADINGFTVGNVPAVGTLLAAGPFPSVSPSVFAAGGGGRGLLGTLAPSVLQTVQSTFVYLNPETFIPLYYPFGHPMLGWTIRSVTSLYVPTTPLNLPLFDNRASGTQSVGGSGQGSCGERPGEKEGQSAPRGGCEEGVIK